MTNEGDRSELFVQLLAENERHLMAYVMTFVYHASDADDILQETKLALWRSFAQFELGTNFGAWARRATFNRILDFQRRKGRESNWLVFSDSAMQAMAVQFESESEGMDERIDRLEDCIAKLPREHRRIVALRYNEAFSIDQVAEHVKRSVGATYRVLSRIRLALHDCAMASIGDSDVHSEPTQ
ncbi:RNA polymerase sigma-70 ECF-like, Rhodopirellula baltica [Rhodopirellula europaea SH398]|uniref:RNA polymerase sigma-70 ECF-like, Rhodopirellula baltica n=1 Tax=Rhodopirellula europaea SH398 TaxID=1263868 RepID=M5S6T2_9BACT|nr:RNA polymerase sigma-70 ECF-like, Rhodopirellula baltica [Rhodopirellula europaea SH398]